MSVEEKAEARADGDAVVGEKKKRDSDDEAGDLAGEDRPATVRAKVDTSESDAALARARSAACPTRTSKPQYQWRQTWD